MEEWDDLSEICKEDFQLLLRDPALPNEEIEFFINDRSEEYWLYGRDPSLRLPIAEAILQSSRAIPVLTPEIQLLFKAKYHREKDEHDFEIVLPLLSREKRDRLRQWLEVSSERLMDREAEAIAR